MIRLIKQVFLGLTLATKCISVNNEPFMTIPTLVDINPIAFNYYLFMISLDESNGSFNNDIDDLCSK